MTGPAAAASSLPLFDHALQLHRQDPGSPLPLDGCPFPDEWRHPREAKAQSDGRRRGADVAALLDTHFAQPGAAPGDLADVLHRPVMSYGHNTPRCVPTENARTRPGDGWFDTAPTAAPLGSVWRYSPRTGRLRTSR
jgi:hypothetical protein